GLYIASAVGSPAAGRLADMFGARRVYLVGLILVMIASVAGPFMPTVEWLVADRVVLGLGASIHFPAAMAIIRQQAEKRNETAVGALGIIAVCGQTSAALGPTLGGLVVVLWGWQGIFWINIPLVLLSFLWVALTVPADAPRIRTSILSTIRSIDPLGMLLFVAAIVLLMLGLLSLEGEPQWLLFLAFIPVASLFVLRELTTPGPFVDVRLMISHRQFAFTLGRAVLTFISFYSIFYGLPQWLEASRGLNAASAGLLMLPVFAVGVLSTIVATRLGRRMQPRMLLVFGTAAMVVAGGLLALLASTSSPIWLLALISVLLGIPNGFNNLGNQIILHNSVPGDSAGAASGIYRTAQYFGAVLSAVIVAHVIGVDHTLGGIRSLGYWIGGLGVLMLITNLIALYRGRGRMVIQL
ncbi:MAG TPA: MFS transporter, partial [Glaciihabitans sp.]|nr:MFS transporter [Glaciihabitans sp.]